MNLVVYGTRPEEIKLYPFTKCEGYKFLQVNQSKDLHQGLIRPNYRVEEKNLVDTIKQLNPDRVLVQGDTRTTFRAAIAAYELGIEVGHIEAGLRTHDITDPRPEEGYRQMVDCIATWKFCSTEEAAKNCGGLYVGQTAIDTLWDFYPWDTPVEDKYIVTVHRNNADLPAIIDYLKTFPTEKLIIFAHPNKVGQELKKHFDTHEPLNYREFVKLLASVKGCISDSGGLQEEMIALGKEFKSLRMKSERGHGETYAPGATAKIVEVLNG